jgi:hypothetical protein
MAILAILTQLHLACEQVIHVGICIIYMPVLTSSASPILLNALAALLTTIINIYTAKNGDWSIMAVLTSIDSSLSVASVILIYIYKFRKLKMVIEEHLGEIESQTNKVTT